MLTLLKKVQSIFNEPNLVLNNTLAYYIIFNYLITQVEQALPFY